MAKYTEDLTGYNNLFYMPGESREQDSKNRQNSIFTEDLNKTGAMWTTMSTAYLVAQQCYNDLLQRGIAKEIARFVLPQGVFTRLYVTGSCRSWIHYLGVRDDEGVAQYEHVELARAIRPVFNTVFPTVSKSCFKRDAVSKDAEIVELKAQIQVLKSQNSNHR